MTAADQIISAVTIWRENRSGGAVGMQSILNVIMNRAAQRGTSAFVECLRPAQFSSMTEPGPEAVLWPSQADSEDWAMWQEALALVTQEAAGTLEDITEGSTNYYAPAGMPGGKAPYWAASMTYTVTIANQLFYK